MRLKPSAEMQSVYSITPANWAIDLSGTCLFQCGMIGQLAFMANPPL